MARRFTKPPPTPPGILLSRDQAEAMRAQGKKVTYTWVPNPGMQEDALRRLEFEIGIFGGKYSGKSSVARAWLVKGNPELPDYDADGNSIPVNSSYVYHPHYRGLILRRNQDDLDDFIRKAAVMWRPYGLEYLDGQFRADAYGSVIDVGHMKDKQSWQRYIGIEYVRMVIEEAALIPDYDSYEELRSCCRSIYPEMRAQMLLTSNAGGPGTFWVFDRFIEPKDINGDIIPAGTTIEEHVINPYTGGKLTTTRVFLFATIQDNPIAMKDTAYIANLASITDDARRRAYLLGDWKSYSGQYFKVFRPRGPQLGDPPNANHVIPAGSVRLAPWWHRSSGMDWGHAHEAAWYMGCTDPNTEQVHICDELVAAGASPMQFGYEIGQRSKKVLMESPTHSMILHLSPDAFQDRTGDKSIAELIGLGIGRVIGPQAVHLPDAEIAKLRDSGNVTGPEAAELFEKIRLQHRIGITIRMAINERVIGWQYVLEALRFDPIGESLTASFDPNFAAKLLAESGWERWLEYVRLHQNRKPEVLPKLQIWGPSHRDARDGCPRLIEALPKAQHSELNPEDVSKVHFKGMDSLDSIRYLLMGLRDEHPTEPFQSYWERRSAETIHSHPLMTTDDKIRLHSYLKHDYETSHDSGKSFSLPRANRRARTLCAPQQPIRALLAPEAPIMKK
jgi:hypothetical protein